MPLKNSFTKISGTTKALHHPGIEKICPLKTITSGKIGKDSC
jgi:hypothetical protein